MRARRVNRPSALDVSIAAGAVHPTGVSSGPAPPQEDDQSLKKRRFATEQDSARRPTKKLKDVFYKIPANVHSEAEPLPDEIDDFAGTNDKPVRRITRFTFFDPTRADNPMVSLEEVGETLEVTCFEAVGYCLPQYESDDFEGDSPNPVLVHLRRILRTWYDPSDDDDTFWVETEVAWYILYEPSDDYRPFYYDPEAFYFRRRIVQKLVYLARNQPLTPIEVALQQIPPHRRPTHAYGIADIDRMVVRNAVNSLPDNLALRRAAAIKYILRDLPERERTLTPPHYYVPPPARKNASIDNHYLRHLLPTHVAPHVAELAAGLFEEDLQVVGARLLKPTEEQLQIGDTIIALSQPSSQMLSDAEMAKTTLADHMWFGRLVYIHPSATFLGVPDNFDIKIADPHELFLTMKCDTIDLASICGKVKVHFDHNIQSKTLSPCDFFARYSYDYSTAALTSIKLSNISGIPEDCPGCSIKSHFDYHLDIQEPITLHVGDYSYHQHDFVLIQGSNSGPAQIAHIQAIVPYMVHGTSEVKEIVLHYVGHITDISDLPPTELRDEWTKQFNAKKHYILDICAGISAFSQGIIDGLGCNPKSVQHSCIELSPSAAKTIQVNFPSTIIYNQCSNLMLQYAVKHNLGLSVDQPAQLYDLDTSVPLPPNPQDEYWMLCAGFPCPPHSSLNMFQKANDFKGNLFLNTLSWIEFIKPVYCVFENVPGFLATSLLGEQINEHQVSGGIEMGALKLTVKILLDLGYQVRFGLLQAAHYDLPQPTHFYEKEQTLSCRLDIKLKDDKGLSGHEDHLTIHPIHSSHGVAPYNTITIHDAFSDLPDFCCCLFEDILQLKRSNNIIHKFFIQKLSKVTLSAGSDYRTFPAQLHEYQTNNPISSMGRHNFQTGEKDYIVEQMLNQCFAQSLQT
ncbi:hypothetical protein FISHEDRAFT_55455 [Fistulina hepatica ATCC 64428]|uniref:DNA (cytosine-5-)-methyltransferase n=1 Tax=Fistulina hepatica ATCC 64428 TaxID=1128425 RepID=A0A0D7AQN2_9AGAR|nr:hypothetical protein FISHEDRAFT_55455 [Fistulina hepatica ATCC 64428]